MTASRPTARRRIVGATLAAVLVLAACGGDDDDAGDAGDTPTEDESTADSTADDVTDEASDDMSDDASDDMSDDASDDMSDEPATTEEPTEEASGLPAGEYTIGFEALTSGPAAFAGVPLANGANLAVKIINEEGLLGEGVTLRMDEEDAGGDAAKAIGIVEGFLSDDVSAVLCCALSSVAGSVKPILANAQTAGVVTSAILPGLNEPPYMYRPVLLLGDPAYKEMIDGLNSDGSMSTGVIVVTADNDGMTNEGVIWADAFSGAGIEVLETVDTATGDTDFSGPATQIIDENPDVVALSMLGQEATLLAKALRDRGYEGRLVTTYGISNAANYEIGGDTLDGIIFPIAFTPQMTTPEAVAFTEAYEAEHGEVPDVFAAQGYTAVLVAAEGLRLAGTGDSEAVAQAMAGITEMTTPYGQIVFEDGQASLASPTTFMQWNADGSQTIWTP
ncbi:MAG: ABC transporter substrate-binding protein [Ilumatobacteraceae bacterium]|nr:ABC transporter substrate-binding protein [Ilumatobacteraceae bacterium]